MLFHVRSLSRCFNFTFVARLRLIMLANILRQWHYRIETKAKKVAIFYLNETLKNVTVLRIYKHEQFSQRVKYSDVRERLVITCFCFCISKRWVDIRQQQRRKNWTKLVSPYIRRIGTENERMKNSWDSGIRLYSVGKLYCQYFIIVISICVTIAVI